MQRARQWGLMVIVLSFCGLASGTFAAELRLGGHLEASGTVLPAASGSAAAVAFAGLGSLEAESRTEFSLFPYTVGSQTLGLHLTREWLSVGAEYTFSLLPLGITSARFLASAEPGPQTWALGEGILEVGTEGQARLVGYTFATTPLRAELWARGSVSVSRSLGWLDAAFLGAALEATLSSPNDGCLVPVLTARGGLSIGPATVTSETVVALAPAPTIDAERVSLRATWGELGIEIEAILTLAAEPEGTTLELRLRYDFGSAPLRRTGGEFGCPGGVCR